MRGVTTFAAAAVLAALSVLPAQAKMAPVDAGQKVCELDWQASLGAITIKQNWSGSGEMIREELNVRRTIPASDGRIGSLQMAAYTMRTDGKDYPSRHIFLGLGAPYGKDKNQRLVIAMPAGEPMVITALYGGQTIPLSEAQLARLLGADGPLHFRLITVDRRNAEKKRLASGWFDLSGFENQPLAGLGQAAERAQAALAAARRSDNPPCVMASAADMNMMESDEPTRKWLSFNCSEDWESPLGAFGLTATGFSWRPRPRDGVTISFAAAFRNAPNPEVQRFLIDPSDPHRYGPINVMLGNQDWGANYRSSDPALQQSQSLELRRGKFVARKWLSQTGSASFFWSEFSQLLADEGDLQIAAHDKVTGKALLSTLSWSEVLAAEEELRAGRRRLLERERDPMARCKAVVEVEMGTEEILVT